jgi:antitoxin YefM
MNVVTFTEARSSFKAMMDAVCQDHTPTVITRVGGDHVVMLSLDDYNSLQETVHLLSSARNASRLMESVAQLRAGRAKPRALIHGESQGKEQESGKVGVRGVDRSRVG